MDSLENANFLQIENYLPARSSWSNEETEILLRILKMDCVQKEFEFRTKPKARLYTFISEEINRYGFSRDPHQCKVKVKNMKRLFYAAENGKIEKRSIYHDQLRDIIMDGAVPRKMYVDDCSIDEAIELEECRELTNTDTIHLEDCKEGITLGLPNVESTTSTGITGADIESAGISVTTAPLTGPNQHSQFLNPTSTSDVPSYSDTSTSSQIVSSNETDCMITRTQPGGWRMPFPSRNTFAKRRLKRALQSPYIPMRSANSHIPPGPLSMSGSTPIPTANRPPTSTVNLQPSDLNSTSSDIVERLMKTLTSQLLQFQAASEQRFMEFEERRLRELEEREDRRRREEREHELRLIQALTKSYPANDETSNANSGSR